MKYNVEKLINQTNFCPLPFIHVNASVTGYYRPCCNSEVKFRYDPVAKESSFTTENASLQEAFYSKEMTEIRQYFLQNKKHPACEVCWRNEDKGIFSARKSYKNSSMYRKMLKDRPYLSYIDVKFNNKCNLSCKMCDPNSSNQIWKTVNYYIDKNLDLPQHLYYSVKIKGKTLKESAKIKSKRNFFVENKTKDYLEILKNKGCNFLILKITGGEPFLSEDFIHILDNLTIEEKQRIHLKITTNGTKFYKNILDKIKNFKEVNFTISIDGTENYYNYIRYPYTWSKLNDRILNLIDFIKINKINNWFINIACLVQSYNFTDMHNVYKYKLYLDTLLEKQVYITYDFNVRPTASNDANISVLPYFVIEEGVELFKKNVQDPNLINMFNNCLKNHMGPDLKRQQRFKQTLINFDKERNQDFRKVMTKKFINWIDNI